MAEKTINSSCSFRFLLFVFFLIGLVLGNESELNVVSYNVLEGITEPFDTINQNKKIPQWKIMKDLCDKKVTEQLIQSALYEYGQLIKNPTLFREIPLLEKYDIFMSMAKLLKKMGFYQRSELLLYEAMSYSKEPHDAHYQLGLLLLDKENIPHAKIHFKNCLYYKETDTVLLVYLSTILLTEGKIYEAKFYITRILTLLEGKITQLSKLFNKDPVLLQRESLSDHYTTSKNHQIFRSHVEDLIIKVYSGEYIFIPSATLETFNFYTNLLSWIQRNEITGRFLFDLGQTLYERGKSNIGFSMMKRGSETSDVKLEGFVSIQVIQLRLEFEYPTIPVSVSHVLEAFVNIQRFLTKHNHNHNENQNNQNNQIDLENIIDIYWPLPLLGWSGLPVASLLHQITPLFFNNIPIRKDYLSQLWLTHHLIISTCLPFSSTSTNTRSLSIQELERENRFHEFEKQHGKINLMNFRLTDIHKKSPNHRNANYRDIGFPIEIGILGGHFNGHAIGQFILNCFLRNFNVDKKFFVTLIALPLIPDYITTRIARYADRIINLPADPFQGWKTLEQLQLDILIFPDWQPFPDTQSIFFQSTRIAPVQICLFVRGTSCNSLSVDYYLMPSDVHSSYLIQSKTNTSSKFFTEQVVIIDWPILTPSTIFSLTSLPTNDNEEITNPPSATSSSVPSPSTNSPITTTTTSVDQNDFNSQFIPEEIEGKIFFEDNSVALLAIDPSTFHPIMDEPLLTILRTIPQLQILIVIPEVFCQVLPSSTPQSPSLSEYELKTKYSSLEYAKQLIRRLWLKGEQLHQRIRLLPTPYNNQRLLQLMKQVDLILDTFPLGTTFYPLGFGLSVGTPIVSMNSGVRLSFAASLNQTFNQQFSDIRSSFLASTSLKSFYSFIGIENELIADSIEDYIYKVVGLINNKERLYKLRIEILDLIDRNVMNPTQIQWNQQSNRHDERIKDLERFLINVGIDWSRARVIRKNRCK